MKSNEDITSGWMLMLQLPEVSSGLKVAGAGVVAGTAALIAAPVIAAKEDRTIGG